MRRQTRTRSFSYCGLSGELAQNNEELFLEGGDHLLLLLSISMIFVNGRLVATLVE